MSGRFTPSQPPRVVVLGAGVAGLEALMALRYLAGSRARITLVAPDRSFTVAALAPLAAFGLVRPPCYDLGVLVAAHDAELVAATATGVDVERRRVRLDSGEALTWQRLVVAIGARPVPALRHADTATPGKLPAAIARLRDGIADGSVRSVAFVVPAGVSWTLPAYELALLTRRDARAHGAEVAITVVTPESSPLGLFGPLSSRSVAGLLADAGIAIETDAYASVHHRGRVTIRPYRRGVAADRIVALARPAGPYLEGLPQDPGGFLRTDRLGRVRGVAGVYAAGECTDFPVRYGGTAARQADAAAADIAVRLGATCGPLPFRPFLRGRLITGSAVTSMRHQAGGGAGEGHASFQTGWGPHAKLSARFLSPWLESHESVTALTDLDETELGRQPLPA